MGLGSGGKEMGATSVDNSSTSFESLIVPDQFARI